MRPACFGWPEQSMQPLADFAVIGDPDEALTLATELRRKGFSVYTQFSGKRDKQYMRADTQAVNVIDAGKPEDIAKLCLLTE